MDFLTAWLERIHRWTLQRILLALLPTLGMAIVLAVLLVERRAAGEAAFDDASLADMAVARTLVLNRVYGLQPSTPCPATRNSLWRIALAAIAVALRSVKAAALLMDVACSIGAFILALRLARRLFPFPSFLVFLSVLLIVTPGLLTDAISGGCRPLATLLLLTAISRHIESLQSGSSVLSLKSALIVTLLVLIRIEFVWLWAVFVLDALLHGRGSGTRRGVILLRAANGFLLAALALLPVVARNVRLLDVPWPPTPGAPMMANHWLSGPLSQNLRVSLGWTFAQWFRFMGSDSGATILRVAGLFVWGGALLLAALSWVRREERPFLILALLPLLLPLGPALFSPYTGTEAGAVVTGSASPIFVILAAFGLFRLPFAIESVYRKWKPGLPTDTGFQIWWAIAGGLLLMAALRGMSAQLRDAAAERQDHRVIRDRIAGALHAGITGVATDSPGWLAFNYDVPVVDLSGEFTPELLYALDRNGAWRADDVLEYLIARQVSLLILWRQDGGLLAALPGADVPLPTTRRIRPLAIRQLTLPEAP